VSAVYWTLDFVAALSVLVMLVHLRREVAKHRAEIAKTRANELALIDILGSHRLIMDAYRQRLESAEGALVFMTRNPTCPQALGARIARLELMLLPQTWDTPTAAPASETRGGQS
jgi:hypothetical protein